MDAFTVSSSTQQESGPVSSSNTLTIQGPPVDAQNLGQIVGEWRRLNDDISQLKQQVSEKTKRSKILEAIILNIMKQNNLGALDLKSSGARVLYEKKEKKGGLNGKKMQQLLTEHLKDETKAAEAVKYLIEHRDAKTTEKLFYEKL
jgi:hypothetical protein